MKKTKTTQQNNNNNDKEETILNNAEVQFANGKIDEALLLLDIVPEDSSNYGKALFLKSMILGITGNEEQSWETFKKSIATEFGEEIVDLNEKYKPINPEDPKDLFDCGITNYFFGDYENAIKHLDLSLHKLPNQSEAIYYKALSYAGMEEYKKAIKYINHAIELEPTNSRYWNDKGAFFSELNQIGKAQKCFNKSIRLKPDSLNWSNKALLYHKCNNLDKALECYDKAMELDPQDIYPVLGKAKVHMELEEFKKAEKYFALAEKIDENDLEFLVEMGKYMLLSENYKQALKYFNKCLKFNDNLAFVWMFKSMALKKLFNDYEAELCVEKAMELDSGIVKKFNEMFC